MGRGIPEPKFTYEMHAVRGDATNSALLHQNKAHVSEVTSVFGHYDMNLVAAEDGAAPEPPSQHKQRIYCDLAKVPMHCGAAEQRLMFLKQCKSFGLRTWGYDDCEVGVSN